LFICLVQYFCGHPCVCPSIRCDNVSAARQAGSLLKRAFISLSGNGARHLRPALDHVSAPGPVRSAVPGSAPILLAPLNRPVRAVGCEA
jgi:hypothetical protein